MFQPIPPSVCISCHNVCPSESICNRCHGFVHIHPQCSSSTGTLDNEAENVCILCQQAEEVHHQRSSAQRKMEEQADRMLRASRRRFSPIPVNTNVIVPIPDVDRGRADPRNIMGVVLLENNGFYQIGTGAGILSRLYVRSELSMCPQQLLDAENVPANQVSLREAVIAQSIGHGQGLLRCSCQTKCQTGRCKCKKSGLLCNSRCHSSLSCCNK